MTKICQVWLHNLKWLLSKMTCTYIFLSNKKTIYIFKHIIMKGIHKFKQYIDYRYFLKELIKVKDTSHVKYIDYIFSLVKKNTYFPLKSYIGVMQEGRLLIMLGIWSLMLWLWVAEVWVSYKGTTTLVCFPFCLCFFLLKYALVMGCRIKYRNCFPVRLHYSFLSHYFISRQSKGCMI